MKIATWTPFQQQAAYELFVTDPSELRNWSKSQRIAFLITFENV